MTRTGRISGADGFSAGAQATSTGSVPNARRRAMHALRKGRPASERPDSYRSDADTSLIRVIMSSLDLRADDYVAAQLPRTDTGGPVTRGRCASRRQAGAAPSTQ